MKKKQHNKPVIETIVNTVALALTSFGVVAITVNGDWKGYLAILFGMAIEFMKYWGRDRLW